MTNAINTLTSLIGKEKAEFYTSYLSNGNTLTVYTLDGEFIIKDKYNSTIESSFKTGADIETFAEIWGVDNVAKHMVKEGERLELSADMEEVEETPEVEESSEGIQEISAIDTAAELVAEGADINETVQMITAEKGYEIGNKVRDHFLSLKTKIYGTNNQF